jgi:DNA topoisomerase-1
VLAAWLDGGLLDDMMQANKGKRRIAGLDDEEALVLRWLKARERG